MVSSQELGVALLLRAASQLLAGESYRLHTLPAQAATSQPPRLALSRPEPTRCDPMKLGFALARLSSKKSIDVPPAEQFESQEPAYTMLNDQTWTAVFSWLSTADLARSRVSEKTIYIIGWAIHFAFSDRQFTR